MLSWGSLVAVALAAAPALATGALLGAGPSAPQTAAAEEDPQVVWLRDCAVCHGTEAEGSSRGTDLAGTGTATLDYVLRTGRMPIDDPDDEIARGPAAYDSATIDALVDYAAGLQDGLVGEGPEIPDVDVAAGHVAAGGQLWREQCAACHRWSGDGGALSGAIAPDVRPATPRELGDAVRSGPFAMPRFGAAALSDDDLNDLAAFVHDEIDHPDNRGGWALGHIGPVAEGAAAMVLGLGSLVVVTRALGTRDRPGRAV